MANLLVLDPDEELRRLIGFILTNGGHHVVAAVESPAGIDPKLLGPVDLILCDVGFLVNADWTCVADLKRLFPTTKVVGLSAAVHAIDPDRLVKIANENGLAGIIGKPFAIRALLDLVSDVLK